MSSQKQSLLKNAIKILCIDKTSRTVLFKDALDLWLTTNYLSNKQSTITKYKNIIETHLIPDIGKELQYYIDTNRIKTLFVPSLKVLGNDIRIITNYIIFLYRAGVVIKVANKDERKIVQEIIRTVHIASNEIKEK